VARNHGGKDGILQGRPANWASEQDRVNARGGTRAASPARRSRPRRSGTRAARVPTDGSPPQLPTSSWCDLSAQFQLSYAFDALTGNVGRTLDRFCMTPTGTGHPAPGRARRGLRHVADLQKALREPLAKTGAEMQSRLRRLTQQDVDAAIGDLVGPCRKGAAATARPHPGDRQTGALRPRRTDRRLAVSGLHHDALSRKLLDTSRPSTSLATTVMLRSPASIRNLAAEAP